MQNAWLLDGISYFLSSFRFPDIYFTEQHLYNNWFASACAVWLMSVFYFVPRLILLIWNMEKRKILSLNSVCIHLILRFLSLTFLITNSYWLQRSIILKFHHWFTDFYFTQDSVQIVPINSTIITSKSINLIHWSY